MTAYNGPPVRYRVYGYVPERHLPVVMMEKTSTNVETTYRLFGDHLGSLRAVVRTSDGVAVQWMRHGPWGEVEGQAVASGFERVPFGFAGGVYEDLTGLVRFGAREYDPRTGRWLSKDEARFGGGENFYEYGASAPSFMVDASGHGPKAFFSCLWEGKSFAECWDDEYDRVASFGSSEPPGDPPDPPPVPPKPTPTDMCSSYVAYSPPRLSCCEFECGYVRGLCPTQQVVDCIQECIKAPWVPPGPRRPF